MARHVSQVDGARELNAVLRALPVQLAKNALSASTRAGAIVLQREAYLQLALAMESRAPRPEDVLVKQRRTPRDQVASTYEIGPPRDEPQLRWLHDGTRPHDVSATENVRLGGGPKRAAQTVRRASRTDAQALRTAAGDFYDIVEHPGQPPRPWLRRAYLRSNRAALRRMAVKLSQAIAKQARRLVSEKYRGQQLARIRRRR